MTGRSYNRFEAERELSDHCLHSTVSTIQSFGVAILRREETVPGYQGIPTRVMRYWICPGSRERAALLVTKGKRHADKSSSLGGPAIEPQGVCHG
jgi:hypothetical protein